MEVKTHRIQNDSILLNYLHLLNNFIVSVHFWNEPKSLNGQTICPIGLLSDWLIMNIKIYRKKIVFCSILVQKMLFKKMNESPKQLTPRKHKNVVFTNQFALPMGPICQNIFISSGHSFQMKLSSYDSRIAWQLIQHLYVLVIISKKSTV